MATALGPWDQRQLCQLRPVLPLESGWPRELDTEITQPHSLAVVTEGTLSKRDSSKVEQRNCVLAGHSRLENKSTM